ncbi:unnamed protein product [Caenorhabditis angaria]|uniref:Vta1/callose synthase N-terminal domain-containing protein n=1 Tax=Caenorhabditis angaria TaxID=860376 RepID=A0A9P1I7Q8_9PELO|nr:unnamed protein product [Caenorhabditis angaria]
MSTKVPPAFKPIAHYIKIANENASRDPVIYYWCLFYAVQSAMQLDKSSPEALQYLTGLLTTLEAIKKQLHDNEAIKNETIGQAHIEDFALKLFNFADNKEKEGKIDKSVVHAFYTAGHIMDILSLFGEVEEPFLSSKKYAKWKSTQIFACLRDGTPYVPSSAQEKTVDDELAEFGEQFRGGNPPSGESSSSNQPPSYPSIGFAGIPPQVPQPPIRNQIPHQPPVVEPFYDDSISKPTSSSSSAGPTSAEYSELRKYTKYALSAIDYEDVKAIRDNLSKALALLQKY